MAEGMTQQAEGGLKGPGWRSWLVAALLAFCYTISYVDRQVISLLIEPVKAALSLSDTQFGLLQGISFSLFYVAASLPLAWLADRKRRSRLMAACVFFWSVMTMLCAFAANFWHMLLARIGVAAGESGLTPAALATLSDRFDSKTLPTATAMYMLAPFVGGGLALAGGGALYGAMLERSAQPDSFFSTMDAWQWVFLIVGIPGILAAALLLLIRDKRPASAPGEIGESKGMGEMLRFFRREWKLMGTYAMAMSFTTTLLSSYVTWLPAAIMRSKDVNEATMGTMFGPIYLISGAIGTISAGVLIMTRGGEDKVRSILLYMMVLITLLWPLGTFGLMTSSFAVEIGLMGLALFLISSITSLSSLPFQYVTPRHLRAQALAILAAFAALFGTGFGPILAGILSDRLTGVEHPLSVALSLISAVVCPVVLLLLWIALRRHSQTRLDLAVSGN